MALVNYDQPSPKYLAVVNNNQPAQSESEPRIKSCSKYIACALVLFASKAAWDAIQPSEPLDNSIKHYETDSEAVIGPSYVIVIFTLLFGLGSCGIFARIAWDKCRKSEKNPEAEQHRIKEDEVPYLCVKAKENAENVKWKKFNVEFYVLPTEIVEGHLIPSCKLKTLGVLGKVSKEWNEFSKHAIIMHFLNKNPAKTLGKLKIYKDLRDKIKFRKYNEKYDDKGILNFFRDHTIKITHLPEKFVLDPYWIGKFSNLERFTLGFWKKVTELSLKVMHLKLKTIMTKKNLKIQDLINLKTLTIDNVDGVSYRKCKSKIDLEIVNLPNLEKITINCLKIKKLCFDQCFPSQLCLGSKISMHNIDTLTSLKDLIISCADVRTCPVTNSSIERVYVGPEHMIACLPNYPLLHTLVIDCFESNFALRIDIKSLIAKYPALKKVMITSAWKDVSIAVEDYVEEFKQVFEMHGIQLVQKMGTKNENDYFIGPELDLCTG